MILGVGMAYISRSSLCLAPTRSSRLFLWKLLPFMQQKLDNYLEEVERTEATQKKYPKWWAQLHKGHRFFHC